MTVLYLQIAHWAKFDKFKAGVMETLERLSTFLDETDPDMDLPNIVHAFQTAERIRERHPDQDWFHLTGLIHDLGKVSS
jgi:inositol oxygenase